MSIAQLGAGGTLSPHVHSYEESFYILAGQAVLSIKDHSYLIGPGDYGCLKVGTLHSWRTVGVKPVRWLQMAAPQPKAPRRALVDPNISSNAENVPAAPETLSTG